MKSKASSYKKKFFCNYFQFLIINQHIVIVLFLF